MVRFERGRASVNVERGELTDLLRASSPAVCFVTNIGDAVLTLPTLRALGEMFSAPLTLICPKVAFDLCFWEVSPRFVDTTGLPLTGTPPMLGQPERPLDYEVLASEIGAVDIFIDTLPWNSLADVIMRPLLQRLAPTTSIGFSPDIYDIVVPKEECHSADLTFTLARLFDSSLRIESYAQPVPLRPRVQQEARSIRAAVPAGESPGPIVVRVNNPVTEAPLDEADRAPLSGSVDQIKRDLLRVAELGVDEVMWDLTQAEVPYNVQLTLLDQLITARPAESVGRRREL